MRKILGIPRRLLVSRFMGEAVLFSLIAMVIGAALVEVVLKLTPINELLGKSLTLGLKDEPVLLLWMVGLSVCVGLITGGRGRTTGALPARTSRTRPGRTACRS